MIEKIRTYLNKNKRILFVGIGNVLRHDDGVGVYISQNIKQSEIIKTLTVEQSIENYIGKINAINPELLILIDCVDFRQPPGFFKIIPIEELADRTSGTHNISFGKLSEFFEMSILIMGIQPENVSFGEGLSGSVEKAAHDLIRIVSDLLNSC